MRVLIGICFILLLTPLFAQKMRIKAGLINGYDYNIYHSPDQFQNESGQFLSEEQLIQSGGFTEGFAEISYFPKFRSKKYPQVENKKHWLYINGEFWGRRYHDASNAPANQSSVSLRVKHRYRLERKWKLYNEFIVERENRLGLNIFGDELLTSFSYYQYNWETRFAHKIDKYRSVDFFGGIEAKDYDRSNEEQTLSYLEPMLGVEYEQEIGKSKLEVKALYRDRNYTNRITTQLLDPMARLDNPLPFLPFDPDFDYPTWIWRYFQTSVTYRARLSNKWKVTPQIGFKRRGDGAGGDFTYRQMRYGLRLKKSINKWTFSSDISFTNRKYQHRVARQNEDWVGNLPRLHYKIWRLDAEVSYKWKAGFKWVARMDYLARLSNANDLMERTRRDYQNYSLNLGLNYTLIRDPN